MNSGRTTVFLRFLSLSFLLDRHQNKSVSWSTHQRDLLSSPGRLFWMTELWKERGIIVSFLLVFWNTPSISTSRRASWKWLGNLMDDTVALAVGVSLPLAPSRSFSPSLILWKRPFALFTQRVFTTFQEHCLHSKPFQF